jgi:hypothetical protein
MKHYVNLVIRPDISAADLLIEIEKVLKLAVGQITGFRNYELLKANEWSDANQKCCWFWILPTAKVWQPT